MNEGSSSDSSASAAAAAVPAAVNPKESAEKIIEPIRIPTAEEVKAQDVWNNCAVRSVVNGVMGGVAGVVMGIFVGALEKPITDGKMTFGQQIKFSAKQMGTRGWGSCKGFAVLGAVYSAAECVIEKARAKHDITNTAAAGCVTGGAFSARGGPQAACLSCAGFAAFSVVFEKFLDRHE